MRLFEKFDAFLIDIDGTVVSGTKPAPKAASSVARLRKTGKPFLFVTNNARFTPRGWAKRLQKTGFPARAEEIVTSADSTALFIRRKFKNPESTKAFVSGGAPLLSEIAKTGVSIIKESEVSGGCDVVIIGGHPGFNYNHIAAAGIAIRNGALFLATNSNFVYPAEDGSFMPATGALAASIEKVSRKKPVITGKPHPGIFRMCLKTLGTPPQKTAIIGDSLKTDIRGGKNAGIKTVLTLTGISSRTEAEKSLHKPDHVINDLSELF